MHNGQKSSNGCPDPAATAAVTRHVTKETAPLADDVDSMDVEAPLFSAAAIAAAAGAGSNVDVEVPLLEKNGDEVAGRAREATAAEKRSLADLKRRATNVPLRLDPRERYRVVMLPVFSSYRRVCVACLWWSLLYLQLKTEPL